MLAKIADLIGLKHGGLTKRNISNALSVVADLKDILKLQVIRIFFQMKNKIQNSYMVLSYEKKLIDCIYLYNLISAQAKIYILNYDNFVTNGN